MHKTNKLFKIYDQSIMGYLNYIGMILFSFIVMVALIFYRGEIPGTYLNSFVFISIYIVATANINRCVLPYRRQQPGVVFVSKQLLLKHLFFTIKKGYSVQLLLACFIALTFLLVENQYFIMILALIVVMLSFASQLLSGLFNIINRILLLLQFWYIITSVFEAVMILQIVQSLLIYIYISNSHRIPLTTGLSFLKSANKQYRSGNILYLFLSYITSNKILIILIGALVSMLTYFAQSFLTKIENLPALILVYINFITILEILIGSKKEEIVLDRARIETLQSSLIVSPYERFKSSTIYLLCLVLIFVSVCGIVGVMINTSDISIILKNTLSLPLIIFIGVVYFRKTELLINDYEHKLLKLSLPILLLICITIFTITS
ncbi:hypothetical protein FO510_01930 [Bacillus pumilus]|nr:hypothetical membrane protein [Bacillus pumilus ATCC 7061]MBU8573971.1 hypothetical protein [Bacillus pumilus]PRS52748.1 hypothetical protein C6Y05_05650 [Bacillus sp. LNXM10]MBU8608597.1 hypothetical protein [Bacillus pumilus]MCK6163040.1 hypothetical protein [Bacillus pumilus]